MIEKFVLLLYFVSLASCYEKDYIPKDWVDHTDMRNYDRYSKSMKPGYTEKETESKLDDLVKSNANTIEPILKGSPCDNETEEHLRSAVKRFEMFVERFINQFIRAASLPENMDAELEAQIRIFVKGDQLRRFRAISKRCTVSELSELDRLLTDMLLMDDRFSFDSIIPQLNILDRLIGVFDSAEKATVISVLMIFAFTMYMFAMEKPFRYIFLFLFLIFFLAGLTWNWWHMYQEIVIKKFVLLKKFNDKIPDSCVPSNLSAWQSILYYFKGTAECEEYYKAAKISPFSSISPMDVFVHTFTMVFMKPLKLLGEAFGEFIFGFGQQLPWPINWIMVVLLSVISPIYVIFFVVIIFGGTVKFSSFFSSITMGLADGRFSNPLHQVITNVSSLSELVYGNQHGQRITTDVRTIRDLITNCFQNQVGHRKPSSNKKAPGKLLALKWPMQKKRVISRGPPRAHSVHSDLTSNVTSSRLTGEKLINYITYLDMMDETDRTEQCNTNYYDIYNYKNAEKIGGFQNDFTKVEGFHGDFTEVDDSSFQEIDGFHDDYKILDEYDFFEKSCEDLLTSTQLEKLNPTTDFLNALDQLKLETPMDTPPLTSTTSTTTPQPRFRVRPRVDNDRIAKKGRQRSRRAKMDEPRTDYEPTKEEATVMKLLAYRVVEDRQSPKEEPRSSSTPRRGRPRKYDFDEKKETHKFPVDVLQECFNWISANFRRVAERKMAIDRASMYKMYADFCELKRISQVDRALFGKIMRRVFPNLKSRRLLIKQQLKYHYVGLKPIYPEMQRLLKACRDGGSSMKYDIQEIVPESMHHDEDKN